MEYCNIPVQTTEALTLQEFVSLIEIKTGYPAKLSGGGYSTRCPAHDDRTPSLSSSEGQDRRILACCHTGCTVEAICASLGLQTRDLFPQETESYSSTPTEKPNKMIKKYFYKNKDGKLVCWKERYVKGIIMKKIIDYLKIKDAAAFLGVTPNTLRNWEREKKITVYRNPQNAYRLYKKEDLEQLLSNIKPV